MIGYHLYINKIQKYFHFFIFQLGQPYFKILTIMPTLETAAKKIVSSIRVRGFGDTVELQWLKHVWNHENMFETGVVRANEY